MSFTTSRAFQAGNRYPAFINTLIEGARAAAEGDGVVRIQIDNTVRTFVCFSCRYRESGINGNARRVFLQTAKTDADKVSVIYMERVLQEDALTLEYDADAVGNIPSDILGWLKSGKTPVVLEAA